MSSQAPVDTKVPENTVDRVDDIDIDPKEEKALVCASFFSFCELTLKNFEGVAFGSILLDYRVLGLCIQVSRSNKYRK